MGTGASTAVEQRIEAWIRVLMGQAKALQKQSDPAWRHAYGIAQGVGLVLKSLDWPAFPTAPSCAFLRLVQEDQQRRSFGEQAHQPDAESDPFVPALLEGGPRPEASGLEENAEQLIVGYLNQTRSMARNDAAWRHAYGLAQGFGVLRQSALWPPYPLQAGSRFRQLVRELGGVEPEAAPAAGARGPQAPQVPQLPQAPQLPKIPRPPQPPAAPGLPEGMPAFRALPTMLDPADLADEAPSVARSMPTMLEAPDFGDEDEPPAPPAAGGQGAFRAMPTMLEAPDFEDEDEPPAPAPARAAGQDAGAFRAMPTMLEAPEDDDEPAPPPARRSPPRRAPAPPPQGQLGDTRRERRPAPPPRPQQPAPTAAERVAGKSESVERIGRFKIVDRLGKGAMGQVFKGQASGGEVVAIKVLHPRYGKSKRIKARFVREAKAVERIQHPGVVRFVESGEEPGVGQYFAMEYVDGEPMHELLRKRRGKPFELHTAMDYALQLGQGLRAAHSAGVIHRDLKPENVLVSREGQVKITDFSLARRDKDSMLLTRPGQVMGTPHFMAPEQARGEEVDARADLYSLGALIYVLLTGQFPFPNGTVAEVIQAHCEHPRPDPRAINDAVPEPLAAIVMKLMAIDRAERHQTIDALLKELVDSLGLAIGDEDEDDGSLADALPAGAKVGGYVVQSVLGAGGMGAVYRAQDSAGQQVALKVLPQQPGRPAAERVKDVARFLNEAKLASRVVSPNTYRILAHGVDDSGQAFIATSYHQGVSLRQLTEAQGFLSPDLIIKVARGIISALKDVHDAGIVHRDVTPANVMLTGEYREAKDAGVVLIDFGLAIPAERDRKRSKYGADSDALFKHRVGGDEKEPEIDEDSLFLEDLPGGTPAYMAPEVLEDPSLVDGRADLYGLGATLYHAATGHPPYTGDSMEQVLYQQRNQLPPPISQFNADFPDELAELIQQLLGQQPGARPRSAKLCMNKLQRLEDPSSGPTYRPPAQPVAPTPASSSGVVVAAAPPSVEEASSGSFMMGFGAGVVVGMILVFAIYFLGLLPPVG